MTPFLKVTARWRLSLRRNSLQSCGRSADARPLPLLRLSATCRGTNGGLDHVSRDCPPSGSRCAQNLQVVAPCPTTLLRRLRHWSLLLQRRSASWACRYSECNIRFPGCRTGTNSHPGGGENSLDGARARTPSVPALSSPSIGAKVVSPHHRMNPTAVNLTTDS